MPITKSAIKTLRQEHRKTLVNQAIKRRVKAALRKALAKPSKNNLSGAFSILDRATKKHFLHKNKASRLKSRITKLGKK